MSRKQAWKEVVDKVLSRLSRWKMKLLSIGGRLTLLKSVLGSMPIFHMSIFKVPSSILKSLESIRSRFFNGQDPKSNKASWVKWNKVLTPKDKGGLGVSSLFALNRAIVYEVRGLQGGLLMLLITSIKWGMAETRGSRSTIGMKVVLQECSHVCSLCVDKNATVSSQLNAISCLAKIVTFDVESEGSFRWLQFEKGIDGIDFRMFSLAD
ncbi:hypothetical protein Tco_1514639 [Tanacetum coccineum]